MHTDKESHGVYLRFQQTRQGRPPSEVCATHIRVSRGRGTPSCEPEQGSPTCCPSQPGCLDTVKKEEKLNGCIK